ncbi:armadillo-type protein [Suillus tomentosus]|nr:armadillo-type protein [Suillus tomentosus]
MDSRAIISTSAQVVIDMTCYTGESLTQIPSAIKNGILDLYTTCVVMSKNPVPSHSSSALHDFIGTCVTSNDLTATVLPAMEKALLRSPEYSQVVLIADFLLAYSHNLDSVTFKKLLTASLNSAVRTNATGLFKILISKGIDFISVDGKTTGPEHRLTLYAMLATMPPSAEVSATVVQNVPQLLVKETNDAAIGVLVSIMAVHLTFILKANMEVPTDATAVIAKEMTNTKPVVRRAFVSIAGSALWNVDRVDTDAVLAFLTGIISALETNLKVVTAHPLTAAVGPLEGYVALALFMGPLTNTGKFGDVITRNASIEVLTGTQAKPSFVISDKIYQKLTDVEDELWLLRAANLSLFRLKNELLKSEQLQLGSVFVHLSIHSQSSEVRRVAIQTIEAAVQSLPQLKSAVVKNASVTEETEQPAPDNQRRCAALILCCGNKGEAGAGERDDQLVDLIVLAHHSAVCPPSRMLWIELCQKTGVDPHNLISRRVDQAMSSILTASTIDSKFGFADASYRAISTSAFVCPQNVLPKIMEQLRADIDPSKINALSEAEFGIWETPEGMTCVDVLSSQKGEEGPKKGKDADIARWEAELRKSLANKTGYGVKLILPSLLSGLDEKQWRSKKGSIELMGMMAYCSPRQLSLSLPIVIPRLTGVLTDTHAQVKTAANKSLKQFGEVINNPEIQALVPTLLKALVDPAKTTNALSALLKTSFMHYIDHSSLALVIPIIERGLRERGTEGKKRAAQIVGNLASLTDSKDFVPYLSSLLPLVHVVLVDPVPEARATAAKALGTLVERLGEAHFPDVVPGLLRTLKTDTSGVDRQGAAQGLSEVLSGLGMERLEGLLPDIIANAQSPRSTVREGFMSLLVYLPATFGARFQPHLPKIISPILSGLSDTEEYVREAAMRAGRMIVTDYSTKAIDLLLPELEQGMFDAGWRIRQSSITLVGELLFKVSGISGKAEVEDEEEVAEVAVVESSRRALTDVLGEERRNRILSALYLARQDAVNVVRQSSVHIWKALVHNTPRTVREILPELVGQLVKLYSSEEFEQQETASRTTAELSHKSGEKVLGEIFSILHTKSHSPDICTREGVCLMLCDVIESTSDAQRDGHENEIINMVRASLVDDDASVRSAAAKAFHVLQEHLGVKAIDQTIPTLLEALRQPGASSDTALQALREVLSVRASTVFPVLIPALIATPMTVFNARALASLVTVAGHALSKRLIELRDAIDEAVRAILASIEDPEGLNTLMLLFLGWAKSDAPKRRISSCNLFAVFCEESDLDSSLYRVDWVRQLVSLFDVQEVPVHTAAWQAFDVFVKSVPKDELESLVVPLRRTIESTGAPGRYVPGFSLQKGVAPTVPIIIAGLTNGSNEQRENAAYAIGDLVERTEESAIKPFVVSFTGPLICVATQATTYPLGVKTAILSALASMLERIPGHVKPFFPQLQRTFVKAVSDTSSAVVRTRAADALGILVHSQPRVDPVVTELIAGARSSEEEIAASFVLALSNVVKSSSAHGGIGDKARESCIELVHDAFRESHEDHYVQATAALIASLSTNPQSLKPIVNAYLISGTPPSALASHAIVAVLSPDSDDYLDPAATLFAKLGLLRSVALKVKESAANERSTISRPAREARDILKNMAVDEESLAGIF